MAQQFEQGPAPSQAEFDALNSKIVLTNATTSARFGANPNTQDAYLSLRFYETSTKWTDLIFDKNGISMRRTADGGSTFTWAWQGH